MSLTFFSKKSEKEAQETYDTPSELSGVEIVHNRYAFYRDNYRVFLRVVLYESIVLLCFAGVIVFLLTRPVQERFFATTADGKIIQLTPLNEPNLEPSAVLSWASRAVVESFTYGFHDRRMRHQEISRYFTRKGWDGFQKGLNDARIIEMIEKQQMVVSAVPESAPVIVQEGVEDGLYQWILQIPVVVTYQGGGKVITDHLLVKLRVERTSALGQGLGIAQWIASHEH